MSEITESFVAHHHYPSVDQVAAIRAIVQTMANMADGVCDPLIHLSSLDPGIGKTTAVCAFVRRVVVDPAYDGVGVLFCIRTLDEIENLVRGLQLPSEALSVLTSDARVNALGQSRPDAARVLITTQRRLEMELEGRPFSTASRLFYGGAPRHVRVWDESWLPGRPITVSVYALAGLLQPLSLIHPVLVRSLVGVFDAIRARLEKLGNAGSVVFDMPDFLREGGVNESWLLEQFEPADQPDPVRAELVRERRELLTDILQLSGKQVRIRNDGRYGGAVVDYEETMPTDLAPLLVIDASGRLRVPYADMERRRRIIQRLPEAPKSYRNLRIHVWQRGGGKSSWQSNGDQLVEGICRTIETKPTEDWLIVHHKKDSRVGDVEEKIRRRAKVNPERLHFITWGKHTGINNYSHIGNIILAGTLFMRESHYEGLKRLGAGLPCGGEDVTADQLNQTRLGEFGHDILQALCRGRVRRSDGDACQPCDAYIIASVSSGIPSILPTVFPEAEVVRWSPVPAALSGRPREVYDYVLAWAAFSAPGDELLFRQVRQALGIQPAHFTQLVRHSGLVEELHANGVIRAGGGRYYTKFQLASDVSDAPDGLEQGKDAA
ncbi:hypothetical protein IP70_16985 [alpha proteobacterium AAP38]|nr:hypothetical protein IP70_16985 [alpha proteobacterium AAP38]